MSDTRTIETLSDAIAGAMPDLEETEARIAVTLYRALAEGKPVEHAEIARRAGVPESRIAETVGAWPGVFHNDEGQVVGFWGLALGEMPHRFTIDGTEIRAWCAWDPLFIGPLLGKPGRVVSKDAVTGEELSLRVTPDGVEDLSHEGAMVSFLKPDEPWDENVVQGFCHYVLYFTSRESGEKWTAEHEGTFLLSVKDAFEIGRRTNAVKFGKALAAVA